MALGQTNNVIQLFDDGTLATEADTAVPDKPTDRTGSEIAEKTFVASESEVFIHLLEELTRMPEEERGSLLQLLQGPLVRRPYRESTADDVFFLPLEDEPVVSQEQHANNVENLRRLGMITPETLQDVVVTEE